MHAALILSLASAFCSAISTVLKHGSAANMASHTGHEVAGSTQTTRGPRRVAAFVVAMLTSPLWLAALIADAGGVTLQVLALRIGDLAAVQPVLTTSLVIALIGNHLRARSRPSGAEIALSLGLVAALVGFLSVSGAMSSTSELQQGRTAPAVAAGVITGALVALGMWQARHHPGARGAPVLAIAIAAIYAGTAGLIKTCTRIFGADSFAGLVTAWRRGF